MADQDTNTGTEGHADASRPIPSVVTQTSPVNIAEEVGLPTQELSPPPPPPGNNQYELARILEEVKLPQRKEYRGIADAPVAQSVGPAQQEAAQPSSPEPQPEPKPRDTVSAVHTLKDDFQTAVYDNKISLVQAAALEETKRAHKRPDEEAVFVHNAKRRHALGVTLLIGSLVLLGSIALGASILIIRDRTGITPSTFLVQGLLFSEQTIPLPILNESATEIRQQFLSFRSSGGLTLGAITRVAPLREVVNMEDGERTAIELTLAEFLSTIDAQVPEELLRALGTEFFLGFHTVDENAPVLIIPVLSYERAFAGMLAWERTINTDLSPIFTPIPPLIQQSDGSITERVFEDSVMRNYDIRQLRDDNGTVQLYYSFPTRNILIIAESPYSFAEVLSRLRADRRL